MPDKKPAVVTGSAFGLTGTGKDQLAIGFRCEDGEEITYYQMFESDGQVKYAERVLQTLGWDPLAHGWSVELLHDSPALIGREVSLVIINDEYDGKLKRKVQFVNEPGSGLGLRNKLTPAEAASFGARLRARLGISGTIAAPPVVRPAPTPAPAVAQPIPDDCPF